MNRRVVVDSNIVFSALISGNHQLLRHLNRSDCDFLIPAFAYLELFKHSPRIQRKSTLEPDQLLELVSKVLEKTRTVNADEISLGSWTEVWRLCRDVDPDDVAFVALALEKSAALWTNDKRLKLHLEKKGFIDFFEIDPPLILNDQ